MESISHFEQNLGLRDEGDYHSVYHMGDTMTLQWLARRKGFHSRNTDIPILTEDRPIPIQLTLEGEEDPQHAGYCTFAGIWLSKLRRIRPPCYRLATQGTGFKFPRRKPQEDYS
jgi:hypothetical protein